MRVGVWGGSGRPGSFIRGPASLFLLSVVDGKAKRDFPICSGGHRNLHILLYVPAKTLFFGFEVFCTSGRSLRDRWSAVLCKY